MKTRVASRVEPALASERRLRVARRRRSRAPRSSPRGADSLKTVEWLLEHGAEEVLVLPRNAPRPQRVLIHWADEAARARHARRVGEPAAPRVAPKRSISASCPKARRARTRGRRHARAARCALRSAGSARARDAHRAAPSARRSPSSRATSRPAPRRCWCSASPTFTRPRSAYAQLLAAQPRLAGAHRLSRPAETRCVRIAA